MPAFLKLKDLNWVRQSFLVHKEDLDLIDFQNRTFTSASLKFTDTSPGGNIPINPPPQFTRTADIKAVGKFTRNSEARKGHTGMGRYYSEAIDDNSQVIHMRFGVPKFNSLSTFFTGFYNSAAGQLARTGRGREAFYLMGRATGFVVSILAWPIVATQLLGVGLRFLLQKPSSKFYYLKATMPLYWNAVNTMVNQISVNTGVVPRVGGSDQREYSNDYTFPDEANQKLHDLLPDIFAVKGGIDVYAMANRAQRLARKRHKALDEKLTGSSVGWGLDRLEKGVKAVMDSATMSSQFKSIMDEQLTDTPPTFADYMKRWWSAAGSLPSPTDKADNSTLSTESPNIKEDSDGGFRNFTNAELDDGSAFVSFRVNATGPTQESFTNGTKESDLQNKINGMSSASRSTNFSMANGNIIGGAAGALLGEAIGAVKTFASGIGDQLEISGLAALGGAAFVDMPKHWESSAAQLPRASYTISLTSPYGNPISQLINLHIPLAMILAGGLPLSTGKQSYTSPFLVELYDQGRCQTRLGMIDSISISRGTGNLGFNNAGKSMGIEVTFTVMDMSSILHMPIEQGTGIRDALIAGGVALGEAVGGNTGAVVGGSIAGFGTGAFDDDTVFTDYLAVISGMGLSDQIYSVRKLKLNLTMSATKWSSWTSTAHMASMYANFAPVRLAAMFYRGTVR